VDDDGNKRLTLSHIARAFAADLARCADLIDSGANPESHRVIGFQLQRAGLHIGNAVRAAERGLDRFAIAADVTAEPDGVMA
jgi:hypothetical protein